MCRIQQLLMDALSSKDYIEYKNYHAGNIFSITKTARLEQMHSSFLAWLLDSHASHDLGAFPAKQLIGLLLTRLLPKDEQLIELNLLLQEEQDISSVTATELPISSGPTKKDGRIDIFLEVSIKGKTLPVIIENKVESIEHNQQTDKYYKWGEEKFGDNDYKPFYVYLTPADNYSTPNCKAFLPIKYQDVIDYVLEPSLWQSENKRTIEYIKQYLRCLSYQTDYEKGGIVMGISSEERRLIVNFLDHNQEFINTLLEFLVESGEESDDDQMVSAALTNMRKRVTARDYTKYKFAGELYGKGRLVEAVVKRYINENPKVTLEKLEQVFPQELQTQKPIVRRLDSLAEYEKNRYYYSESPIDLHGELIVICKSWWIDNIPKFVDHVNKHLGYGIEKE